MATMVTTLTRPTGVRGFSDGNKRVRYWDLTSDTGDYPTGGFTLTAAQLGMKSKIHSIVPGGVATQGTAGASSLGVGFIYAADSSSVTVQLYESAASGAPGLEKGAEPMVANFTIRFRVEGQ